MKLKYEWIGPTTGGMLARELKSGATTQLKVVVDEEGIVHALTLDQFKVYQEEKGAPQEAENNKA